MRKRIDFARALVHELKTPLTPIMATTEILLSELKEEPWAKMIGNIQRGGESLKRRIDDLLDLAKGEVGMLTVTRNEVSPLKMFPDIAREMEYIVSTRHQKIRLDLPEYLPEILFDENRIKQVISSLLSNASKFSPDKSEIVLKVGVEDDYLLVSIKDEGIGISQNDQERLFQPYERSANDDQRLSGLGLGLALSRNIVELHGGKIWVESEKGKGSTFYFTIPMESSGGYPA